MQDFGGSFHQQQPFASQSLAAYHGGHVFVFGREGQLALYLVVFAQLQVVDALAVEPQQQGSLGGVAYRLGRMRVARVEIGSGVAGQVVLDHDAGLVAALELVAMLEPEEVCLVHLHLVLGERARLVGADDGGGSHGLAGVHLAHQVVAGQHAPHAQGQAQGHTHGKAFGHRYHNQGHGQHHSLDEVLQGVDQALASKAAVDVVDGQAPQHDGRAHDVAAPGYPAAQLVKLLHERGLEVVLNLGVGIDFAILGGIAHVGHLHHAMALAHARTAQQHVGGIGGLGVAVLLAVRLAGCRLAGERALVDGHLHAVEQLAVGRYFLAGIEQHHIAHYNVAAGHLGDFALAHDLDRGVVVHLVENVKFLVGVYLYKKTHHRGQHDGQKYAQWLEQHVGGLVQA